jgi:hypothetical protein
MKQWMPFAALGLLLVLIGGVWASGQVSLTGQARGIQAAKVDKVALTHNKACPKDKAMLQTAACPEGERLDCESDEAPHCCSCEEVLTITCDNVLCTEGTSCEMDCDDRPTCLPDVCAGIAGIACPEGSHCVTTRTHPDAAGQCELDECDEPPDLTCANVLCTEGTVCIMNCADAPECIRKTKCGGITGLVCDDGDVCVLPDGVVDGLGYCVPECEDEACGECVSNNDCKDGERCTASEDCMASCECPQCTVCAGDCVTAED